MKIIYRCSECGEDYKPGSPTAKNSNIGTVNELIYHIDPCPNCCTGSRDKAEIKALSETIKRLCAKLHNIDEGLKRLDDLLKDSGVPAGDICFVQKHRAGISIFDGSTEQSIYFAPTLSLLIDKILTGGN